MRSEFITDVEQQYEVYCKIAEEYGFIDLNAKKNGFRCTTKSNEFNAGWIAFTGAIAAMREDQQSKVDELQKRVEELTVGCGLQRDHIKGLEAELKKAWTTVDQEGHKKHGLVMLLKFIKEHFEMNDLDKAMPRVYEELEQALKGGEA